jgi:hypothetical protein
MTNSASSRLALLLGLGLLAGCGARTDTDDTATNRTGTPSAGMAGAGGSAGAGGTAGTGGASGGAAGAAGLAAPRPLAPLSTSSVSSRTPRLRWALPPNTDGAHVEICLDRACALPLAAFDATGTSGVPATELPAGVVFWRLTGTKDGLRGAQTSPVWQFTVGHRSAPNDASWGTTLDVNGDGFSDLVVGATGVISKDENNNKAGDASVFLGGAQGLATTPAVVLTDAQPSGQFSSSLASAGDVNGDGFADLVVGAYGASTASVFLGSAGGLSPSAAFVLAVLEPFNGFGSSVASAGDVNGDGFADLVVGAPGANNEQGAAYVYLGSAQGLSASPSFTLTGAASGANFGVVVGAGDVNGDGFADLFVGSMGTMAGPGSVSVYLGSAAGPSSAPTLTLTGFEPQGSSYLATASAGDVNGDGFSDLVVGSYAAPGGGVAWVHLGSPQGLVASPAFTLHGQDPAGAFGGQVASGRDLDGDGFDDLVVSDWGASKSLGAVHVYPGGAQGPGLSPSFTLTAAGAIGDFGASLASAGDVNGDGFADLIAGSLNGGGPPAGACVFLGSAQGPALTPSLSLSGSQQGYHFGETVAGANLSRNDQRRARLPRSMPGFSTRR